MSNNVSIATVARTAALGLALANQLLSAAGKPILPIKSEQVEQLVSAGLTIAAAIPAWWKTTAIPRKPSKATGP